MPGPRSTHSAPPPAWLVGPEWATKGLRQPGWLLFPLRGFLAVTFCFAGLQKLANPAYFDSNNPASVVAQMTAVKHASPISSVLSLSLHVPVLVGLLIALGELAVGVGALIGLWTRIAATGGAVLSLAFFLTVSWTTSPYYLGADIVFVFAWITVFAFGTGGVCSVDAWLDDRARRTAGLPSAAALITVDADRLRALCPRDAKCGLRRCGVCALGRHCPVFPTVTPIRRDVSADLDRRRLLVGARTAAAVGALSGITGGITAAVGRLAGANRNNATASTIRLGGSGSPSAPPGTTTTTTGDTTNGSATTEAGNDPTMSPQTTTPSATQPPGQALTKTSAVPVGQAGRFRDPATGEPAWLVHRESGSFVAFSAVCTHAGCIVEFVPGSDQFFCPCHGGRFDASTGEVLVGPPRRSLPSIPVHVVDGEVRVD